MPKILISFIFFLSLSVLSFGQDHGDHSHDGDSQDHATEQHDDHNGHDDHGTADGAHGDEHHGHAGACGHVHHTDFDPGSTAFHHIADQNVYSIGPLQMPLPCILYAPEEGWDFFSSAKFDADAHGVGRKAFNGYVLYDGSVRRILDRSFPDGQVDLGDHAVFSEMKTTEDGKEKEVIFACYNNQRYECHNKSIADGGVFGGGITSFYDFSITKNVMSMFLMLIFMTWMFTSVARAYKNRDGQAPKGLQGFIEPIFLFIQDEVAKPFLGHHWERFLPFLMSLFFFILGLNLFGQIPFLGGSNATGNLAVTMVLAVFTFLVVNLSGNRHYWEHILWMPGVPAWIKTILTPVELMGVFIKPITLMLRLFANITAGHMVMVIFVGLIFLFGKSGENVGGAYGTAIGSTILTIFMMSIELLVAFIQAFVFTILTASYIGAATEEAHH
jgi:F-type H+-transporting ATPase subunit a